MRQKAYIPADVGHFLRTDIDSTDFKNKHLTKEMPRKKAERPHFLKK